MLLITMNQQESAPPSKRRARDLRHVLLPRERHRRQYPSLAIQSTLTIQYTLALIVARTKQNTRERILNAAYSLFRQRGYTRVSIDEIASASGLTKRTLYSHFESKDALLEAVLEAQHKTAFAAFQNFGQKLHGPPESIVRALFSELFRWSAKPKWPGSGFTRLAMELADLPGHPARRIAGRHKRLLEAHVANALAEAGLNKAKARARKLWIIAEGAMVLMLIHNDRSYCEAAEEAALSIIAC